MVTLLNRIAWIASLSLSLLMAFIISDLASGTYDSGAENFFEWGWIWGVGFLIFFKGNFLSRNTIEQYIKNIDPVLGAIKDEVNPENTPGNQNTSPLLSKLIPESILEEKIQEDQNIDTLPKEVHQEEKIEIEKPNWIVVFFSDRPLAKIGGILLFLGALFFLSLVWSAVGNVGKILIGLLFGFCLYGLGVWMDQKGHITESRTLLGVGIAINMLTILSGRWIIGDASGNTLSDSLTLGFLLLNTLLAVVTGLVYTSRTFLIFSFIFAYFIPFLVRSESESAILMILYTAIVSLGGYLLIYLFSLRKEKEQDIRWLFHTIFLGSTILMMLSGFGLQNIYPLLVYVVTVFILTGVALYLSSYGEGTERQSAILIAVYIMLTSALFGMGDQGGTLFIYIIAIIPVIFLTGMYIIVSGATVLLSSLLLAPMVMGLFIFGIFGVSSFIYILIPILGVLMLVSIFIVGYLTVFFQYVFFLAGALFMGILSIVLKSYSLELLGPERMILSISVIVFFLLSLWSTLRYKLLSLPGVSLISSILLLALLLVPGEMNSWIFYILFVSIGFIFPFIANKGGANLHPVSLISYQVFLNLFMIGELMYLGNTIWFQVSSTSLITLGSIIFLLSVGSFFYSLFLVRSTTGASINMLSSLTIQEKNTVSGILAIPLSLFSLAVAVIFSDNALIVSTVWILESTILAYFSSKTKNNSVLIGSIVLLSIGLIRMIPYFDIISPRDWFALVPLLIIGISLFFGVRNIFRESISANIYDILHIIGMGMIGLACMEIIPHTSTGWSLMGLSIFYIISLWFYQGVRSHIISVWIVFLGGLYFLYHLIRLESLSLEWWALCIQLSAGTSALFSAWYFRKQLTFGRVAFIFAFVLSIIITSLYVNYITENVFAVTIYLTLLSTVFLLQGISLDRSYLRTIGLYIGVTVLIKILFYDLWVGVDNLIIRVLALMISGGVMIALSQLYGRKVNRPWSEEFSFENFSSSLPGVDSHESIETHAVLDETPDDASENDMPFSPILAQDIETIDISHIQSLSFINLRDEKIFESKRASILRITVYIIQLLEKSSFTPGELVPIFQKIKPHIQSKLPKKDLDFILDSISAWIISGGSIQIITKKSKN